MVFFARNFGSRSISKFDFLGKSESTHIYHQKTKRISSYMGTSEEPRYNDLCKTGPWN